MKGSPAATLVATLALGATACGFETAPPVDESRGVTFASVRVERSEPGGDVSPEAAPRAEALAGFVRVPALVDPVTVARLVGLNHELPHAGSCETRPAGTRVPLSETTQAELIDAGSVWLEVNGTSTRLAPYAFPTVTDSMGGVLYSTRDRAAEPLPANVPYMLVADGVGLRERSMAPEELRGVTLNGVPLAEATTVVPGEPLDVTWNVGSPEDFVYAELSPSGGADKVRCTFADDIGAGTVPGSLAAAGSELELSLHRLRVHDLESAEIEGGRLFFDFEVTRRIVVR